MFYDRSGNLIGDEMPDGVIGYARDRMGRLVGAVLEEENGQRIETWFERDAFGRVVCERQGDRTVQYAYDPAGSITRMLAELAEPSNLGLLAEASRSSQDWMQPSWQIERGGVLRKTETAAYEIDARGRRTAKVDLAHYRENHPGSGAATEQDMTRYVWDCRDRLREVRLPDGARVVMTYDAFGRRVRKEVIGTATVDLPRVVEFVWDGDVLAADIGRERGARTFVHAPGTFVPLLQQQDGSVLTYVNDHLGTPKELLDPRGLVAWAAAHSAWGEVLEEQRDPISVLNHRTTVESPFRLLGQYADAEMGLCYTRFRFFDPEIGGWCSPDPLGAAGGLHLFAFDGSPTTQFDPLGLAKGKVLGEAGKAWEEDVRRISGGTSQIIEGREIDSVTSAELIQAKDSPTAVDKPKNFLSKSTRNQIKETVRLADDHGKKPVYWFKEEPHPEVRSYIEDKGAEVRIGLSPPTQGKCSS
ncbi:restriction endonuclease fold toxin [Sorangium atrum]|uniref:Restriction endonuclease fold toxin n=1 Tax=Sorangium atrum TaxID=2995308 RepID=A0ABT5C2G5_9BACT|nr:restriction endonuclease fold toxin [Sorangium aterium]MDC0680532.1 restriction endonuclease fold toxin [Sorangium aterium]